MQVLVMVNMQTGASCFWGGGGETLTGVTGKRSVVSLLDGNTFEPIKIFMWYTELICLHGSFLKEILLFLHFLNTGGGVPHCKTYATLHSLRQLKYHYHLG